MAVGSGTVTVAAGATAALDIIGSYPWAIGPILSRVWRTLRADEDPT